MNTQAQIAAEDLAATRAYVSQQDVAIAIDRAKLAHKILDEIFNFVRPGVRESEVTAYADSCFRAHAIDRIWHKPYIRFGEHTLLTYRNKANVDRVLAEQDIAFIDIGVVRDGVEGDAGRTVTFGANKIFQALADASKNIFNEIVDYWKKHDPSGEELYLHTHAIAKKLGVVFNLDPAGHLIGAFPHKGWKKGLNHFPEKIGKGTWILEIQIRHPELPYGAFYEDLLY